MSRLDLPASPPAAAAPTGPGRALFGFAVDLLAVAAVSLLLSTALVSLWMLWSALGASGGDPAAVAAQLRQQPPQPQGVVLVWITLLSMLPAVLLVYFLRRRADVGERAASRAALARTSSWAWMLVTGLAVSGLGMLINWIGERLGSTPVPSNVAMVEAAFADSPLFMLGFAIVLAPAYEELLFRRVLFGRLWRAGYPVLGMLLSGAAFALVHELPGLSDNPWPAMLQLWLVYGLMGVVFAWVYRRTGTLWAAIGAHALNNALACALLLSAGG
ncbi:CPBP family intramembrane metalloprotease [Lysobacter maris]|uniref:CPBP family intramembrane metalloprotease n=1 Tax=Marilutibacter maris TaxID=1605891 RepID=A0A508A1X9_9GAMM|nr:CPBP family intramembrane glutamic endopeptidase [Lysobacter maris]KAB8166937.1 CPBP family intramembrane metalloprotease [Lysobacter maris]